MLIGPSTRTRHQNIALLKLSSGSAIFESMIWLALCASESRQSRHHEIDAAKMKDMEHTICSPLAQAPNAWSLDCAHVPIFPRRDQKRDLDRETLGILSPSEPRFRHFEFDAPQFGRFPCFAFLFLRPASILVSTSVAYPSVSSFGISFHLPTATAPSCLRRHRPLFRGGSGVCIHGSPAWNHRRLTPLSRITRMEPHRPHPGCWAWRSGRKPRAPGRKQQ